MSFRNKVGIIILVLFLFLIPDCVLASNDINISCDKTKLNSNEEISCNLSVSNLDFVPTDVAGTVKVGNDLSIVSSSYDKSNWTSFDSNFSVSDINLIRQSKDKVSSFTIATFRVKASSGAVGSSTISFNNIVMGDDNYNSVSLGNKSINVSFNSDDNTLSSLSVSDCNNCSLSPAFRSNITIYVVNTKSDKINISAVAASKATVTGAGLKTLTKDSETFKIVVTSESGSTKTYRITVNKEKSTDVSLSNLTIDKGNLSPKFSSNVTNYTAVVDSDKVIIKATPSNSKVTVTGTGEKTLEYGKNEFTITVTSEDGGSKSYLITINRPDNRNANAYLKSLTIDGKDIDFEKDVVDYEYKVGKDVDSLDIEAIPELDTSKVEITGNENFKIGKNIVTITVKAEDNSEKIYKIIVVKEDKVLEKLYLDNLKIDGYDIKFNKEIFEYTLTIGKEKSLNIIAFNDNGYTTEIVGNENLKDGSIIKIIVSDEDGNSSVYQIRIKVSNNDTTSTTSNTGTNYIPYIMTSLLVLLFILDLVQIIKKVRNK